LEKIGGNVKIKKIAICGLLSSGKSTIGHILAELGAFVINADDIVHDLLLTDESTINQVIKTFGREIFSKKMISRKKLAQIVFNDSEKLHALEGILHPKVKRTIEENYENVKERSNYKAFVAEIPLFDKLNMQDWFDLIVTVIADPLVCKKRFNKTKQSNNQFEKRLANQQTQDELVKIADIIIENNGSLTQLKESVLPLL